MSRRVCVTVGALAVALVHAAAVRTQTQPPEYAVIDLGPLEPAALNDSRQVAIQRRLEPTSTGTFIGQPVAGLWEAGSFREFAVPAGYARASGAAVNNIGHLAGTATPPLHAFLWNSQFAPADLGVLPNAAWSEAHGVNNRLQVVGGSGAGVLGRGGWSKAVLWQYGTITNLGPGGSGWGMATAINEFGDIVGWAQITPDASGHAFLWRGGTMTDLGSLRGGAWSTSTAHDINDFRQVVGESVASDGRFHGFSWQNDVMSDLGLLPGSVGSTAYAVNVSGRVVGMSVLALDMCPPGDGCTRAVMWRDGMIADLNTLIPGDSGWILNSATDINGQGEIVGKGFLNGEPRYFMLVAATPPPLARSRPATADDCKNGRWTTFNDPPFRNQGECVSFVRSKRG